MTRALATEVLKLRTVRYPWIVLLVSELLVVAGISGLAVSSSSLDGQIPKALSHTGLVALCSLVLGIFAVAGGTATARSPTPTSPSRGVRLRSSRRSWSPRWRRWGSASSPP